MQTQPVKKELRDLDTQKLINKKNQIASLLFNRPDIPRALQGSLTIGVLYDLIKAKKENDLFMENLLKALCFEQ